MRPGTRRNSLFPTRSSTTEASTTVSVTPLSIIPRTPPEVPDTPAKNASSRFLGRNRSTKSPITFRRRLKTTAAPKQTITSDITDLDEGARNDIISDLRNNTERENKTNLAKPLPDSDEEYDDDLKPKRPNFSIRRRRPYNGTRLSWTKKRIIRTTTVTPHQVTTSVSSTSKEDYERGFQKTTKFPRTRINSRANSTFALDALKSRIKQSASKYNRSSPIINDKLKETTETSISGKINNSKNSNKDNSSESNLNKVNLNEKLDESYGIRQSSVSQRKHKSRTTVEPFYITKDYGMVATAVPEITKSYGNKEPVSTPMQIAEDAVLLAKDKNVAKTNALSQRKEKKRTRIQVTEAPKIKSTSEGKFQNIEKENDYSEDSDASFEYIDELIEKHTTTESPSTTSADDKWSEKGLGKKSLFFF